MGILPAGRVRCQALGRYLIPLLIKYWCCRPCCRWAVQGRLSVWVVLILVGREFIVSAVRIQASSQGGTIIAASMLGKVKTVLQDAAIIMMLMEPELPFLKLWYLSDAVMAAAVLLTLGSLWDYCYRNRSLFSGL